jgi:coenzyme F420 hydrogenase subunit beta
MLMPLSPEVLLTVTDRNEYEQHNDDQSQSKTQTLPGVPDIDVDDSEDVHVPPVSSPGSDHEREDVKPIMYRKASATKSESGDDCCDGGCTCDTNDTNEKATTQTTTDTTTATTVADGGTTPANVSSDGNLGDIEFTSPSENVSQDVENGDPPDERVGIPDDVELDTPGYSIRGEMNDIETPDEKTWFMELDDAVIQSDRCIQCGTCVAACPSDSIGIGDDGLPELVKMCTGCSLCWDFCPRGGFRYERQWKITGGEDNVKGAGDPITEFSATVEDDWRENAQDGGIVTSILAHLLDAGKIDGALIATEADDDPWKAESFLATTTEELIENAGSFYNQTMALGNLNVKQWEHKLPDKSWDELSLALVGTPCEVEGLRALQDFEWDYQSQNEGVRAIDYTIALMCTKNFNYHKLIGEQLEEQRGIAPEDIGKLDVLHGDMMAYDHDGELLVEEDVENFHDATLKGCDECADFSGFCADLSVGSVGSSDEYSSVIVRTEQGMNAWELTEEDLDYHDLESRSAIGKLQSWDKKKAFESLERPFDPDAPRFIDYTDHAEQYGSELNPHEADH